MCLEINKWYWYREMPPFIIRPLVLLRPSVLLKPNICNRPVVVRACWRNAIPHYELFWPWMPVEREYDSLFRTGIHPFHYGLSMIRILIHDALGSVEEILGEDWVDDWVDDWYETAIDALQTMAETELWP